MRSFSSVWLPLLRRTCLAPHIPRSALRDASYGLQAFGKYLVSLAVFFLFF